MSEQDTKATQTPGESKENKTTVLIGGNAVEVSKLRAGKFYEAQKAFASIIEAVSKVQGENKELESLQGSSDIMAIFSIMPEKMAEFVAICIGMNKDQLLEEAFPEEIPQAFMVCYKLNNVVENLKNFQAPMQVLGGQEAPREN
jgi:hypothetical protein